MENILDSIRRIISRWVSTQAVLIEDAYPGDTSIAIVTSNRFQAGDEAILRNTVQGETPIIVDSITNDTHIKLTEPLKFRWRVSDNVIFEKTFNQNLVQGIYIGDPDVIPRYPAITVNALGRESEWLTLDSTKETFNLQVSIYVRDSNQEGAYRFLLEMVKVIQHGLKQNIQPLVGPFNTTTLKADVQPDDTFIKVNDISLFEAGARIHIEDPWRVQAFVVIAIVDSETVQVDVPACYDFTIANNSQVIRVNRFFYNSWPASIDYGKVFKGTMLKAASIDWFAWEEEIQLQIPRETSLL